MPARIFSPIIDRSIAIALITSATIAVGSDAVAQNPTPPNAAGLQTDPNTGIVYQQRVTTVERPVVETKVEKREQTVYRPQVVTETRPENRTTYAPVVEYSWEPRLHGRWNPFARPTVQYHRVPRTKWEARNEVVQKTNTRTDWVAEKRTVDVPNQVVRMQREQKTELIAVGRVAPKTAPAPDLNQAIASRLRPLTNNETVAPINQTPINQTQIASTQTDYGNPVYPTAPRIAASTVGRMTSDPPRRSMSQGGLRANTLAPTSVRGQALPPVNSSNGIANLPALPIFR